MATTSPPDADAGTLPLATEHSATGIDRLGPSDASDSGSDSAGAYDGEGDSNTDRFGTGERHGVEPETAPDGRDILPDHVERVGGDDDDAGEPGAEPPGRP